MRVCISLILRSVKLRTPDQAGFRPDVKKGRACGPGVKSADALLLPLRLRFLFSVSVSLTPVYPVTALSPYSAVYPYPALSPYPDISPFPAVQLLQLTVFKNHTPEHGPLRLPGVAGSSSPAALTGCAAKLRRTP